MSESIEEMMKRQNANANPAAQLPTREQMEGKVKAFHNWRTAVRSGTFAGAQALHIAKLLDLLDGEHAMAVSEYESAFPAQPQWAKPEVVGAAS